MTSSGIRVCAWAQMGIPSRLCSWRATSCPPAWDSLMSTELKSNGHLLPASGSLGNLAGELSLNLESLVPDFFRTSPQGGMGDTGAHRQVPRGDLLLLSHGHSHRPPRSVQETRREVCRLCLPSLEWGPAQGWTGRPPQSGGLRHHPREAGKELARLGIREGQGTWRWRGGKEEQTQPCCRVSHPAPRKA